MSIKKTRFSYILWLFATGFSVFFIYGNVWKIMMYFQVIHAESVGSGLGYGTGFFVLLLGIFFLLFHVQKKITYPVLSKSKQVGIHIILLLGLTALFFTIRLNAIMHVSLEAQYVINLYDTSKIQASIQQPEVYLSVFDKLYSHVLSVLFLFFGNKIEIMLYLQVFLQVISFISLIITGWILQKSFFAWIPAVLFTIIPLFADATSDMGSTNFYFCIMVVILTIISFFAYQRKSRRITYIAISVTGLLYNVLIFTNAIWSFVFPQKLGFITNPTQIISINTPAYFYGELILGIALIFFCISFWYNDTNYASLCLIPAMGFELLLIALNWKCFDTEILFVMSRNLFLFIVSSEGMNMFFNKKRRFITDDYYETNESTPLLESDYQSKNAFEPLAKKTPVNVPEPIIENASANEFEPLADTRKKVEPAISEKDNSYVNPENSSKSTAFKWWEQDTNMEQQNLNANFQNPVSQASDSQVIFFEDIDIDEFIPENLPKSEGKMPKQTEEAVPEAFEEKTFEETEAVTVIKVSDIMKESKSANSEAETHPESDLSEKIPEKGIDKTAMIENVLPMPKKHVSRTLEYAFEPSDDMMHYDVEIENDHYDYE